MEEKSIESLAEELGRAAREHGARIATAESCTAGGISYAITSVPGSSSWFDRGFVTYTERSKIEMLGVPMGVIRSRGVVSEDAAMAQGALDRSDAAYTVAVTGIAGPDGAEPDKPVGTVCFGFAERTASGIVIESETCHFTGDRAAVRESTVRQALAGLLKRINETSL
jgi:nicotinamide-nucleotide amidase